MNIYYALYHRHTTGLQRRFTRKHQVYNLLHYAAFTNYRTWIFVSDALLPYSRDVSYWCLSGEAEACHYFIFHPSEPESLCSAVTHETY